MRREYGQGRTERVSFALSPDEMDQLKENAAWFQMTVAEFLRHAAVGNTMERPPLRQRQEIREAAA